VGRVEDPERQRVERLARELVPVLRSTGYVVVEVSDVEDVDAWRAGARRTARLVGWRVHTGVSRDGRKVWAASDDWTDR
jgi:hypothetical protein